MAAAARSLKPTPTPAPTWSVTVFFPELAAGHAWQNTTIECSLRDAPSKGLALIMDRPHVRGRRISKFEIKVERVRLDQKGGA